MKTFSSFNKNSKVTKDKGVVVTNKGIVHIEDLPTSDFINVCENFDQYLITEKLDGANLVFGFDNDGRLFTSRESKGGMRFYSPEDYPNVPEFDPFRNAHVVLELHKARLDQILEHGEMLETEVLYGRQPNAIVYGLNYIVAFRALPGDNGLSGDQAKIQTFNETMSQLGVFNVDTTITESTTGIQLDRFTDSQQWAFASVPVVVGIFSNIDLEAEIYNLERFLRTESSINGLSKEEVINTNLNRIPHKDRPAIKHEREQLREAKSKLIGAIKNKLIEEGLRNVHPLLQTDKIDEHEDIGVEGVVLRHKETGMQVKVVDKEGFTTINEFNHTIRNQVGFFKRRKTFPQVSLGTELGFLGEVMSNIGDVLKDEGLSDNTRIKSVLRKYHASDVEVISEGIVSNSGLLFEQIKPLIINHIDNGIVRLKEALNVYKSQWKSYAHTTPAGKRLIFNEEIHKRNLITFAKTISELSELSLHIHVADTPIDLISALYGKQLKSL